LDAVVELLMTLILPLLCPAHSNDNLVNYDDDVVWKSFVHCGIERCACYMYLLRVAVWWSHF